MLEQHVHSVPSRALATTDPELVAKLVDYCNETIHRGARAAWIAVAEKIVEALWDGDLDAALEKNADSHATWRAVLAHPELQLDRSMLSRCRGLLRLRRDLPRRTFEALRVTHLFVLAPVEDSDSRLSLATLAAAERWSVDRLRRQVAALTNHERIPSATKTARKAIAAVEGVDVSAILALPPEHARQELRALDAAVRELRRRVKQALEALPTA